MLITYLHIKPLLFWKIEKVQGERQEDAGEGDPLQVQLHHGHPDEDHRLQYCPRVTGGDHSKDLLRVEESTATSNKPGKFLKRYSKARSSIAVHPALSP